MFEEQYLSKIFQPLTDVANQIKNIPPELFGKSYRFVSLDVETLFTNIILKRIYDNKLINTDF